MISFIYHFIIQKLIKTLSNWVLSQEANDNYEDNDKEDDESTHDDRAQKGMLPVWKARSITAYNPDLLPAEPMPLQDDEVGE